MQYKEYRLIPRHSSSQIFQERGDRLICCNTFEEVFQTLKKDSNVIGLVAIENTIAGSLLHNYELLRESGTTIIGEHKLRISHSIMCMPEDDWSSLTEVNSHPVALAQCRDFLQHHPELKWWKPTTPPEVPGISRRKT